MQFTPCYTTIRTTKRSHCSTEQNRLWVLVFKLFDVPKDVFLCDDASNETEGSEREN